MPSSLRFCCCERHACLLILGMYLTQDNSGCRLLSRWADPYRLKQWRCEMERGGTGMQAR
jgi:hypothetical protein